MSAQLRPDNAPHAGSIARYAGFEPMRPNDVERIVELESSLYTFPWTATNFLDSLNAGYSAWVLRDQLRDHPGDDRMEERTGRHADQGPGSDAGNLPAGSGGEILGYFLVMTAVDEAHLLNISVARPHQRKGFGYVLLSKATEVARDQRAMRMILEVRPSNTRAIEIYERYGFRQIGVRPRYYPFSTADQVRREDALVMQVAL